MKWCVLLQVLAPLHCFLHALCCDVQLLNGTSLSSTSGCLMFVLGLPLAHPCCASPACNSVVLQLLCVSAPAGASLLFSVAAVDLQLCLTSDALNRCAGPADRFLAQRESSASHVWAAPRPWLASAAGRAAQARLQLPAGQSESRAHAHGRSQWQAQPALRSQASREQPDGRSQAEQATAGISNSTSVTASLPRPRRYLDSETDRIARIMASRPKH